jgi:uncharacterized protein YegL
VDGMRLAMQKIEERKQWYRTTGQSYFRPFLVLITDGEGCGSFATTQS